MQISLSHLSPSYLPAAIAADSEVWGRELTFESGKTYLIKAASGRGKSSLVRLLFGLLKDYEGEIRMDGELTRDWSWQQWTDLRTRKISMSFQGIRLFPHLDVHQNLAVKNQLTHTFSTEEINQKLTRLGCAELTHRPVSQLSFGQRQRIGILRSLCQPFAFLLLDEPFSHLDEETYRTASELIIETCKSQGAGMIMTSLGPTYDIPFDHIYQL